MRQYIFTTLLALLFSTSALAQPAPCGNDPSMTSFCEDACVICDIDGFTGINDDPEQGLAPDGFCTTFEHHIQWIAFIAGSTDLTITVTPSNCNNQEGLEVGIYYSLNCEDFTLVSNCDTEILPGEVGTFSNTQPLVVGQYYFFVMDGSSNDVCNYTVNVIEGSTEVMPLPPAEPVVGITEICQGGTSSFSIPNIVGANFYQWRLDGTVIETGAINAAVEIEFPTVGIHELCVTAFNVCDTIDPVCLLVNVTEPVPVPVSQSVCLGECYDYEGGTYCDAGTFPVLLEAADGCDSLVNLTISIIQPLVTNLNEGVCPSDCFAVADTLVCDPGDYSFLLTAADGCDSIVNLTLFGIPEVNSSINVWICNYDSLLVGDSWYHPPGVYEEVVTSWLGCDSVIYLTLNEIICEITGDFAAQSLFCHGDQSGEIVFSVINGTAPFTYNWSQLSGSPSGSGILPATNQNETIDNLIPGSYLITILDNFGNDVVLVVEVYEPPALDAGWVISDFNGFSVSCNGDSNGFLEVLPQGGTPPYSLLWDDGSTDTTLDSLTEGTYALSITDVAGCIFTTENSLTEPPPLTLEGSFTDPTCEGIATGSAAVTAFGGGVPPQEFSLTGAAFDTIQAWQDLPGGSYDLVVLDANGCETTVAGYLDPIAIPLVTVGEDLTLKLGETVRLPGSSSVPPQTVTWAPPTFLSCADCLDPDARPLETTTYTMTVVSEDDCIAADSLTLNVLKIRDFYIPNVFSPNGDGINDELTVFAGKAVSQVLSLRIFSRWGELVFENFNFPPNELSQGWDGVFRGEEMKPGLFVWYVEVEFIDGVIVQAEGEVSLLK